MQRKLLTWCDAIEKRPIPDPFPENQTKLEKTRRESVGFVKIKQNSKNITFPEA